MPIKVAARFVVVSITIIIRLLIPLLAVSTPRSLATVSASHTVYLPFISTPVLQSPLIPLKRCFYGGPSGTTGTVCCMSGYVILDGNAVAGAKITITSPHGSVVTWSVNVPGSAPFYSISLNNAPLNAQVGDSITITVEYSGHSRAMTYNVASGEQQVDVVLPRNQDDDYQYTRQIWGQADPGDFNTPSGVALDKAGRVYVVDMNNERIQVFTSNGQFLQQWGGLGEQPGQFVRPYGIAIDAFNFVYVTDQGNDRVEKYSLTGDWLGTIGASGSEDGHFNNPAGVAVDFSGNVYIADRDNNRIQKFNSSGAFVKSWDAAGTSLGRLDHPRGIAVGPDTNVYVTDTNNHRIRVFSNDGVYLREGVKDTSLIQRPLGITVDSSGYIYVVDGSALQILKFTNAGDFQKSWGSLGNIPSLFDMPNGISLDANGDIYVADTGNSHIQRFDSSGQPQGSWGTYGCTCGKFNGPHGIAVDQGGSIFIVDTYNQRVQKFNSDGTFITQFSHNLTNPMGIAIGSNKDIYVTDSGNDQIQQFHSDGTFVRSLGQSGIAQGSFKNPTGIAFGPSGDMYVADTGNSRIQQLHDDGTPVRAWGDNSFFSNPSAVDVATNGDVYVVDTGNHRIVHFTANGTYIGDWGGYGTGQRQFSSPSALAIDANNTVYVTDTYNSRVQKFDSQGHWLASWGGYGSSAGTFVWPEGIALGVNNSVIVADGSNDRVEVFRPITYVKPIATVVSPVPALINIGQTVTLMGTGGTSKDNTSIGVYQWLLDNKVIGSTPTVTFSSPQAPGPHTLTFFVKDNLGNISDPQIFPINVPFNSSPMPSAPHQWTFLLYLDGDNNTGALLGEQVDGALWKLRQYAKQLAGDVVVVYDGPATGDTLYYHFKPDGTVLTNTGPRNTTEADMGDPQTLIDFVAWGKKQAPADHYYLAITDHGNGLDGTAWDYTSTTGGTHYLSNAKLLNAMRAITLNGQSPIDVLHLDSCLMGLVETAYQLRGMAHYLITSENEAWSVFGYDVYNRSLKKDSTPLGLVTAIVDYYSQTVRSAGYPFTLAAIDMDKLEDVVARVNILATDLTQYARASTANQNQLSDIRAQSQPFDSNNDSVINTLDSYIDLSDWASKVQVIQDTAIKSDASALINAITACIVAEGHDSSRQPGGMNLKGAHGLAIYYPPQPSGQLYQMYIQGELLFPLNTRWADFLAVNPILQPYDQTVPPANPVPPKPL